MPAPPDRLPISLSDGFSTYRSRWFVKRSSLIGSPISYRYSTYRSIGSYRFYRKRTHRNIRLRDLTITVYQTSLGKRYGPLSCGVKLCRLPCRTSFRAQSGQALSIFLVTLASIVILTAGFVNSLFEAYVSLNTSAG